MFHTVYFWLQRDLDPEQRQHFEAELLRLLAIPYVLQGQVGKPAATAHREGVTDHSFDYALVLEFATLEDHDRYQAEDPVHEHFVATCKGLWRNVLVLDSCSTALKQGN
jgi:hypothetical protein